MRAIDDHIWTLPLETRKPRAKQPGPCGWNHCATDARAVGRFDPAGVHGYQAASGGPIFPTRRAAESHECAARHKPDAIEAIRQELEMPTPRHANDEMTTEEIS